MGLAQNPDYAAEVTLQPLARFDLDAAILFSDILTVPHAMGLGLDFAAGEGPRFAHPVRTEDDVRRLAVPTWTSCVMSLTRSASSAANSTARCR